MQQIQDKYDYDNIYLLNNKGEIVLSIIENAVIPLDQSTLQSFLEAVKTQKTIFGDFHYFPPHNKIHLDVITPVISRGEQGEEVVGGMVFMVNPEKFLFPLIQSWPTPSSTAETLLVRREGDAVLFLNTLRHHPGEPLGLRRPLADRNLPAARAVAGWEGPLEGVDYRGVPVLAVTKAIPGTTWHMVAKIDLKEIFRPLYLEARLMIAGAVAVMLLVGAVLGWTLSAQRKRHYASLYHLEQERQEVLQHFEHLVKFANDIILLLDREGNLQEANDRAVATYGYSREELLQLNIRDLLADPATPSWFGLGQEQPQGHGVVSETVHRRRDGSTLVVEGSTNLIRLSGEDYFQAIIRDISERKQAEAELRRREQQYRALVSNIPGFIFTGYADYTVDFFDDRIEAYVGYRVEDFHAKRIKWSELLIPEDLAAAKAIFVRALKHDGQYVREYRIRKQGGEIVWIQERAQIIKRPGGEIDYINGIFYDITARKRIEENFLKEKTSPTTSSIACPGSFIYLTKPSGSCAGMPILSGSPVTAARSLPS
jgi:PAS domain S-box-containing protein